MTAPENRIRVIKFGGTSLANPARVRRAAQRIHAQREEGVRLVVVVSACGHETDELLARIEAVGAQESDFGAREIDRILATGEDRSAALLALALLAIGVPARSLRGGEAGIHAHGDFGSGVIDRIDIEVLQQLHAQDVVPVVSGFQAQCARGETLTLGRGGSDISAVALAAALHADAVHIVTDVKAVYDHDPRIHAQARPFASMSHAQLVALSEAGAQVMHPRAAQLAALHAMPLRVYHHEASSVGSGTFIHAHGVDEADERIAPALARKEVA